jgi:hypothetical protein
MTKRESKDLGFFDPPLGLWISGKCCTDLDRVKDQGNLREEDHIISPDPIKRSINKQNKKQTYRKRIPKEPNPIYLSIEMLPFENLSEKRRSLDRGLLSK